MIRLQQLRLEHLVGAAAESGGQFDGAVEAHKKLAAMRKAVESTPP